MPKVKKLAFGLIVFLVSVGLQAQVSKAEVYTIESVTDLFGISMQAGSVVFIENDGIAFLLKEDVDATQSLNSIEEKFLIGMDSTIKIGFDNLFSNVVNIADFINEGDEIDITESLQRAFRKVDVVFFPGSKKGITYKLEGVVRIR